MKYLYLSILLMMGFAIKAQQPKAVTSKNIEIREKVQIVDQSNYRSIQAAQDFFSGDIKKVVLKQISNETLASVQKNCNENDYPDCIKKQVVYNYNDPASEERADKLIKGLKVYRIAKFDNIRNGKNFGEWSVLVVPASENKALPGGCTYTNDFYILIDSKGIKIIK